MKLFHDHFSCIRKLLADDDGPTAVEYAVLLALILVAVIGAITSVGNASADWWQNDVDRITEAFDSTGG